jgi:hypothetical protein
MEKETIDLRELLMLINEKKELNASLTLEFDCKLEVEDFNTLVKIINYAINYVKQLTDQQLQISLNASARGYIIAFTATTTKSEFPPLSEQVLEALKLYQATAEKKGEAGKYIQILLTFSKEHVIR